MARCKTLDLPEQRMATQQESCGVVGGGGFNLQISNHGIGIQLGNPYPQQSFHLRADHRLRVNLRKTATGTQLPVHPWTAEMLTDGQHRRSVPFADICLPAATGPNSTPLGTIVPLTEVSEVWPHFLPQPLPTDDPGRPTERAPWPAPNRDARWLSCRFETEWNERS